MAASGEGATPPIVGAVTAHVKKLLASPALTRALSSHFGAPSA
jgi:hypothetical protein